MRSDQKILNKNSANTKSILDANQLASLQQTITGLSTLQLAWASGYLAAKSEQGETQFPPVTSAVVTKKLTILYASQTGNAKGVACKLDRAAKAAGISVTLQNTADYKVRSLKKNLIYSL
jgi:sulfite reductase (NADPH) flavoprotein alpha-component